MTFSPTHSSQFPPALKISGLGLDNSEPYSPFYLEGELRREGAPQNMCFLFLRGPKAPFSLLWPDSSVSTPTLDRLIYPHYAVQCGLCRVMRGGNTLFQSCRGSAQVSSSQWLPHPQRPQSLPWLLHCGLEVEGRDQVQTTRSAFGVFPTRPGLEMASITPPHLSARPYICGPPNCKGDWEISSRKERG